MKQYTDQDIINYSKEVCSCAGLLRKLGLKPIGGNYGTMKRKLAKLNIDCSHWSGQTWNKGQKLKGWADYKKPNRIKHHLIDQGGHICDSCKLTDWLDNLIPLELHHKDGNSTNNELSNLQLLCPNCHSLTENFRGRKLLHK